MLFALAEKFGFYPREPSSGLRLLDTPLLAAVTTKPAVGVAGFGVGLNRGWSAV
jgi:hypothetical protein